MRREIAIILLWGCFRWRLRRLRWCVWIPFLHGYAVWLFDGMEGGLEKWMRGEAPVHLSLIPMLFHLCLRPRCKLLTSCFCFQIRAAEDILSLTRILKEAWLFGKLQTVGASEAETRAETAAANVAAGLRRLRAGGGGVVGEAESGETIRSNGEGGGERES